MNNGKGDRPRSNWGRAWRENYDYIRWSSKVSEPVLCVNCPHHAIIDDQDPYDWFCDNDAAIICTLAKNPEQDPQSEYSAFRQQYRIIACDPYRVNKIKVPRWCPLKKTSTK